MAASDPEQYQTDLAVRKLSMLIEEYGKGNPRRLTLDRLSALYDQKHGGFHKCGLGKLKKFVVKHFHFDDPSQEVRCKVKTKKKQQNAQYELEEGTQHCDDSADERQVVGNVLLRERKPASPRSSPASRRRTAGVLRGVEVLKSTAVANTDRVDSSSSMKVGKGNVEVLDSLTELTEGLNDISSRLATRKQLESLLELLREQLTQHPKSVKDIECEAEKSLPNWDEWKRLQHDCKSFDKFKAQFILITGVLPEAEAQYVGLLRKVKWHAIIDLDPDSESTGLYAAFETLPETWMPEKILSIKSSDLELAINWMRSPWLFARGRTKDSKDNQPPASFKQWTARWMGPINRFLTVVAESLDKHRPIVMLLLPFDGSTSRYITEVLTRLDQELSSRRVSSAKHIVLSTGSEPAVKEIFENLCCPTRVYQLPASLFSFGLAVCLGCAPKDAKLMPSAADGADALVEENDFQYLNEFLTLLYKGCENEQLGVNPDAIDDDERCKIIEEHKRSFLSGQPISFVSLNHNHDASRDGFQKLRSNIQRHMDQRPVPLSTVIELVHQPGTGGSTLARRCLWELRLQFPCAIVKSSLGVHTPEEEDAYMIDVSERILALEELCYSAPLVLIDGAASAFRRSNLSRTIAEYLSSQGRKAIILHCLRGTQPSDYAKDRSSYNFELTPKLSFEESVRFREKYDQNKSSGGKSTSLYRTFHFPLSAFLDEFKERMNDIVASTLDRLDAIELQVIHFVALIQVFAGRSVPSSLILKLFLEEERVRRTSSLSSDDTDGLNEHRLMWIPSHTYNDIYESFSDELRVLLVQSGTTRTRDQDDITCDLQHIVVAESVLTKLLGDSRDYYKQLEQYLKQLLSMEKLQSVDKKYVPLFEDLFLHSKGPDPRDSFSLLIEKIKKHLPSDRRAGKLLQQAATVFPSGRFYSHVSRYFVYSQPREFFLAEEMILEGFRVLKPHESRTILHEARGLAGRIQLAVLVENEGVSSIEELERLASKTIYEYNRATTHPLSRPNPLVGKVQVWVKCLEWIAKNISGGVTHVVRYLSTEAPEFFRNILSEAFHHLDAVEQLLATHTVTDVEYTRKKVIGCKMKLCFVRTKSHEKTQRHSPKLHSSLIDECDKLSKDLVLSRYSQKELRRLKVWYLLNKDGYSVKLESLKPDEIRYLYHLLRELVEGDKEYLFTSKLLRVATYIPPHDPDSLTLDDALSFLQGWQEKLPPNPHVHFYLFVLYFLKVLEGDVVQFHPKYKASLRKCREESDAYINRANALFYLGREGSGLSCLVERATFKITTGDDFWKQKSRETLRELEGRIKTKSKSRRRHRQTPEIYFELTHSGIPINVGRNHIQLAGDLGRDYQEDQLVKFVVSFSLAGPTAHGFVVS